MKKTLLISFFLTTVCVSLQSCGQKGPLYIQEGQNEIPEKIAPTTESTEENTQETTSEVAQ